MLFLLLLTLNSQATSPKEMKALQDNVRLESGSVVMLQQHATREKFKNDVFVTLHCPHPYKTCTLIDVKEGGGRIPAVPKK